MIGYLKSEYGEKQINEFIALKPKLYSVKYNENKNKVVAKGVKKYIINDYLMHEHYKNVLDDKCYYNTSMNKIQSKNHNISSVKVDKFVFHPFDDKTYLQIDGVTTLPFGHYTLL